MSVHRLEKTVETQLAELRRELRSASTAASAEALIWSRLLALGRILMAQFILRRGREVAERRRYGFRGVKYDIVGEEEAEVGTRFGKVRYPRPVGRVVGAPRERRDLPLERALGFAGGFTLPVVTLVAHLAATMAFSPTRRFMMKLFDWAPSPRSVLRMVDAAGAEAKPFLEQAPVPDDDGDVLVITVDAKGAPAISSKEYAKRTRPRNKPDENRRHARRKGRKASTKKRRAPGKKSKNAKMAAVGVLYTLRRDEDGRHEGPLNKRCYATFESHRRLFEWLKEEAVRRGYGTAKFRKVLFVGDGAEVLWNLQREFFQDADVCLDWFHVAEKLWAAGKAVCKNTRRARAALEAWVAKQKRRMRHGELEAVLSDLEAALEETPKTGPGNKYRREVLSKVLNHYRNNSCRMQYARLRSEDLEISSGVVEGMVRNLVGMRLDGPGMRWGRDRAEHVLHLRCILLNGQWELFETYLAGRELRLAAQPIPARTHDAVAKAA